MWFVLRLTRVIGVWLRLRVGVSYGVEKALSNEVSFLSALMMLVV